MPCFVILINKTYWHSLVETFYDNYDYVYYSTQVISRFLLNVLIIDFNTSKYLTIPVFTTEYKSLQAPLYLSLLSSVWESTVKGCLYKENIDNSLRNRYY